MGIPPQKRPFQAFCGLGKKFYCGKEILLRCNALLTSAAGRASMVSNRVA